MKYLSGILTASALALSFGTPHAAMAQDFVGPYGSKFCDVEIKSNTDLENRFARSLAEKADGTKPMEGCKARPIDFLMFWQQEDPAANLKTVADLSSYAHDMKATEAKADYQYQSACLWQVRGGSYSMKAECTQREARKGEVIYASRTGKLVLMSNCANPGVIEIPPIVVTKHRCIRVEFPGYVGRITRVVYIDRVALPGYCTKLQEAGVAEAYTELPQECPMSYTKEIADSEGRKRLFRVSCNWTDVERAASGKLGFTASVQNISASFRGRADGTDVLWLPEEALNGEVVVCYDDDRQSYGVRRDDYVDGVAVIPVSIVTPPRR